MDKRVLWLVWLSGTLFLGTAIYASMMMSLIWLPPRTAANLDGMLPTEAFSARSGNLSLTIFTAPAPLLGDLGVVQKMAIRSWFRLTPCPRVVLLGQHPSLVEFAAGNSHLAVEADIDFTFSGKAMFHAMVQRALRVQSGVVLIIDPELILLPDVSTILGSLHEVDHDWLLTGLPRTVQNFPYSLQDGWLGTHGLQVEDADVEEYVKTKGEFTIGGVAQLWAWNANRRPLHAGVMPPFVFKGGQHDSWLLGEALTSKYRLLVDGTEALNVFRILGTVASSTLLSLDNGNELIRLREIQGNIQLASTYGSYHFRPSKLSDISFKVVRCGGLLTFCLVHFIRDSCVCSALKPPAGGAPDVRDRSGRWPQSQQSVRWESWLDISQPTDVKSVNWNSEDSGVSVKDKSWTGKMIMFLTHYFLGPSILPAGQANDCGCSSPPRSRQALTEDKKLGETEVASYTLEFLLKRRANAENVVVLAVVGNSYRDMLMNWVCRLKHLEVSNYLVSAIDDDIYRFAVHQGLPVFRSRLDMNVSRDDCHFGSRCFQKVTKMKSRTVLRILQLGYHVLFSDVDVYWFQDPLKELLTFGPGHLSAQTDQWNETEPWNQPRRLNSGFYFAWSDNRTIAAFNTIVQHAALSERSEQPSFYDVLCGEGGIYAVGDDRCVEPEFNVTVHFLDPAKYPNGAFRRLWEEANVKKVCVAQGCRVLHNNWVSGRKRKLERQIRSGLWDYDTETRMCIRT